MVGIVVVSHSRQLAQGLVELASHLVPEPVPIAFSAGLDDPESPLGTDAVSIYRAIEAVLGTDGAVVFTDFGGARLNAEAAFDLLSAEEKTLVRLSDAPLVEGVVAAVLAAAAGHSVDGVVRQAEQISVRQTAAPDRGAPGARQDLPSPSALEFQYTIANPLGLHARPAAKLIHLLNQFHAAAWVKNATAQTGYVDAKSISNLLNQEILQHQVMKLAVDGADAARVGAAVARLVEDHFAERTGPVVSPEPAARPGVPSPGAATLAGIPVAGGYAIGPSWRPSRALPDIAPRPAKDIGAERSRLDAALDRARDELRELARAVRTRQGDDDAAIFAAQEAHLTDPVVLERVRGAIESQALDAAVAWRNTIEEMAGAYDRLSSKALRERRDDLIDVGLRVLRHLHGPAADAPAAPSSFVLLAEELTPSQLAELDRSRVIAIATARGSRTSHTAILARSLPIPVVFGLGPGILQIADGTELAVDGEQGAVQVDPGAAAVAWLREKEQAWNRRARQAEAKKFEPAMTADGEHVRVLANASGLLEAVQAFESGADGIGLLRTEFLYLGRSTAPDEEAQCEIYRQILAHAGERPVVIRTMDIGGDKDLPYLSPRSEANPFLGWRGIRYGLDHPEQLHTQLRAILRAGLGHSVKIMLPMVALPDEVTSARRILQQVGAGLARDSLPFDDSAEVGIMIEVPSAVIVAEQLAAVADFFSIGTNDLAQYVMAADRTNPRVARLADAFHPAVLRMVADVVKRASSAATPVSVCGEMAGEVLALPLLAGLGVRDFSMTPSLIPRFKLAVARVRLEQARELSSAALKLESARQVRDLCAAANLPV